jgi:uncharacterized protein YneR
MRIDKVYSYFAFIAVIVLIIAFFFGSTGVVRDDPARNIIIPDELLTEIKVKVAYNDKDVFWRLQWPSEHGSIYHDYLVYEDGKWVRYGRSVPGPEPQKIYEDRFTMFVDDGAVENFAQYGGFITVSEGMRFMTSMADPEEAKKHVGIDEVRKFLPETRYVPGDWRTKRSKDELEKLVDAGYFLDFWHWRSHRSNPIGYAEDTFLLDDRKADKGAMFSTNWDGDAKAPKFMFDPQKTGIYALNWDKIKNLEYTMNDIYYLSSDMTVKFDPAHKWKNGDVIPRRLLGPPSGSRADIASKAIWLEGNWMLDLTRAMDTGNYRDDKMFSHMGKYNIAMAVHKNSTGTRWHYVSFPHTLGFGRDAEIQAKKFEGAAVPWDEIEWVTIKLFYPGQITWDHAVNIKEHAGAKSVKMGIPMKKAHSEEEIAYYSIESEFRSEILSRWILTTLVLMFFTAALISGIVMVLTKDRNTALKGGN